MKKSLQNKLDKNWRTAGKENAICEVCEYLSVYDPNFKPIQYTQLHPHHIVGRKNRRLRWDTRNRCWLCPSHHTLGDKSAHNDSEWFKGIFQQIRGDDWDYIQEVKNEETHYKDADYEQIIEQYGG